MSNATHSAREEAARDPSTPADTLAILSEDDSFWVRAEVAANPSTPADILARLSTDAPVHVRTAVAGNPAAPADVLARLADSECYDICIRLAVAQNSSAPADVLARLAAARSSEIRAAVAANPATPVGILARLAQDRVTSVAMPAQKRHMACAGMPHAIVRFAPQTAKKYKAIPPLTRRANPAVVMCPARSADWRCVRSVAFVRRGRRTIEYFFGYHPMVNVTLPRGYCWEVDPNGHLLAVAPSGATYAPDAEMLLSLRAAERILAALG